MAFWDALGEGIGGGPIGDSAIGADLPAGGFRAIQELGAITQVATVATKVVASQNATIPAITQTAAVLIGMPVSTTTADQQLSAILQTATAIAVAKASAAQTVAAFANTTRVYAFTSAPSAFVAVSPAVDHEAVVPAVERIVSV